MKIQVDAATCESKASCEFRSIEKGWAASVEEISRKGAKTQREPWSFLKEYIAAISLCVFAPLREISPYNNRVEASPSF
jgi:hypothetical protein